MAGCNGQWYSEVNGRDDGVLDLDNEIHAHDNQYERFFSQCVGRTIFIQKLFFHYAGTLGNDGMFHGRKFFNSHVGKGPFDEPPAGTWTAQGPIIEGERGKQKPLKARSGTKNTRKTRNEAAKK